ncbi:MAG: sulfatase-like hydrolase/transferase [Pirellulales bacterium]
MPASAKPNILWICTDQQRYDTIAALGNDLIRTPHIDRLVRSGVAFMRAFCQSTVCAPSRASYLTGRYPRTTGCRQNGQMLPARERLISRMLADAGYVCGLAGKQHLASCSDGKVESRGDDGFAEFRWSHHPQPDWPENEYTQWLVAQGKSWDELYGGPLSDYIVSGVPAEFHQTTWCAEKAIDFIRHHQGRPWFFNFNCFDPHHPFDPPAEYLDRYCPADMALPRCRSGELVTKTTYQRLDHQWAHNNPGEFHTAGMADDDHRQVKAAYYAMIELIDDQIGRMIAVLEETGQLDNTLIVFMSDHGEMLGDHGIYFKGPHFYEGAVRVPLVLVWKGRFKCDVRATGLVELVDLVPTLLEAAGLEIPQSVQGRSLTPLLRGEGDPSRHRDSVYCEYYNAWTHERSYGTMMRTADKKIAVYHGIDEGEFYDLNNDPNEFENLYFNDDHAAARERLLKQAFDASVFVMDPLPLRRGAF